MISAFLANGMASVVSVSGGESGMQNFITTSTSIVAAILFILALKWLSAPSTARRGNLAGEIGMVAAIVGALLGYHILRYEWIVVGFTIGALIGAPMAIWMSMTAVSVPVSPVAAGEADVTGGHSAARPPVTADFAAVSFR